jgi:hypothetical protein
MYKNIEKRADLMAAAWFDRVRLLGVLRSMQWDGLMTIAQRESAKRALAAIREHELFSGERRFPAGEFICQCLGHYSFLFPRLLEGLNSRLLVRMSNYESDQLEGAAAPAIDRAAHDQYRALMTTIDSMIVSLEQKHFVYNREMFEQAFRLDWVERAEANKSAPK